MKYLGILGAVVLVVCSILLAIPLFIEGALWAVLFFIPPLTLGIIHIKVVFITPQYNSNLMNASGFMMVLSIIVPAVIYYLIMHAFGEGAEHAGPSLGYLILSVLAVMFAGFFTTSLIYALIGLFKEKGRQKMIGNYEIGEKYLKIMENYDKVRNYTKYGATKRDYKGGDNQGSVTECRYDNNKNGLMIAVEFSVKLLIDRDLILAREYDAETAKLRMWGDNNTGKVRNYELKIGKKYNEIPADAVSATWHSSIKKLLKEIEN